MPEIILAIILSFLISLLIIPPFIGFLSKHKIGQNVRDDIPKIHLLKEGTPTMGGIVISLAIFLALLISGHLNSKTLLVFLIALGYALVGLVDDCYKVKRKSALGIKARYRLLVQAALASFVSLYLFYNSSCQVLVPFLDKSWNLGYLYIPFVICVLVGTANAVNLTDGLDGLAIGAIIISLFCFMGLSLKAGHQELSILCAVIVGVGIGFLWFNVYPAKVFMGDTGSLFLGSALAMIALLSKLELFLLIVGGIFVLEVVSVIIQVIAFRSRGRRVFKMSPIHHHFELSGWSESQITVRFWVIGIILALIGLGAF